MFIIQGKVGNSIFVILYLCILCAKVMSANIPSDDGSQKPLLIRLIDLASSDSNHVPKEKNQSTSSEFKVDESQKDELSAEVDGSADPNEYKSGNWKYDGAEWPAAGNDQNRGKSSMDKDDADLAQLYKYYESQRPFHDAPSHENHNNKEYNKEYDKEYVPNGPVEMPVDHSIPLPPSEGAQYYSDEPKYGSDPIRGGSLGGSLSGGLSGGLSNARSDGSKDAGSWRWDQNEELAPRWDAKFDKFHGRNHDVTENIHKGQKDVESVANGGLTADVYHRDEDKEDSGRTGKSFKQRSGGKQFGSHHEEAVHHSKSSHTNPFDSRDSWKGW